MRVMGRQQTDLGVETNNSEGWFEGNAHERVIEELPQVVQLAQENVLQDISPRIHAADES